MGGGAGGDGDRGVAMLQMRGSPSLGEMPPTPQPLYYLYGLAG